MQTDLSAYCEAMRVRREQIQPAPKGSRIDIDFDDPYKLFSREQIQMRRKVEALRFAKNRGPAPANLSPSAAARTEPAGCPPVPMPSSSSGVPGPPVMLVRDPAVPLHL